ncbi:MAG: PmoA family protein [Verrucomicrobiales bacterium]|nr:PmoA family protein [Verrucomicrobiales bacterium]
MFIFLCHVRSQGGDLLVRETDAAITVLNGRSTVLVYNKAPTADTEENDPVYTRSGYIHPVFTPSGKQVTDDFAPDHPHQHGLFFAWTRTSFEGRSPEFWNQKKMAGGISYAETVELIEEDDHVGFEVRHRWDDLTAPIEPKAVLTEKWEVLVRKAEKAYVIDLVSRQSLAGERPLVIEKYHYGGMAIRGSRAWMGEDDLLMRTNEGLGRIRGNHTRPESVVMSGLIDGSPCGILAIQDPSNFRYPQWVRLHPAKPYFVFSPMVEEPFTIEPGEAYVSKYRYVIFDDGRPAKSLRSLPRP